MEFSDALAKAKQICIEIWRIVSLNMYFNKAKRDNNETLKSVMMKV